MNFHEFQPISKLPTKGVTLIIVVFAMMVLGVLGWTLSSMQATDFQINAGGNLDSERALYLAEAGAQYALTRLSLNGCWRTNGDCTGTNADCNDAADWLSAHSISPGQYRVCCRQPVLGVESGDAVIESRGYIPQATEPYRAMRQVKVIVQLGSLTKAVMTQVPDPNNQNVGLFNWSAANAGHIVTINGNINAGHYSGDGDANLDEAGQDYGTAPMLPPGAAGSQRDFTTAYPSINMQWFHDNANQRWPESNNVAAQITNIQNGGPLDGRRIWVSAPIFTSMNNQALCSNGIDDCADWYNYSDKWRVITAVGGGGSRADLNQSIKGIWQIGHTVKLVRRFASGMGAINNGTWYIGRSFENGPAIDTLIDVINNNRDLDNTYIICEGNIIIKGAQRLRMRLNNMGNPVLATKTGSIISVDNPLGVNDSEKIAQRTISGMIYSEFGEVNLNYLRPRPAGGPAAYRGNLVYGHRVTLDGRIRINYLSGLVSTDGFTFAPGTASWEEE